MRLYELLGRAAPEILEEDYGSLNFLDKQFRFILKQQIKSQFVGGNEQYKYSKKEGMSNMIGNNAIIEKKVVKTAADIQRVLEEDELRNLQFVVLETNGKQFAVVRKFRTRNPTLKRDADGKFVPNTIDIQGEYRYEIVVDKKLIIGDSEVPEMLDLLKDKLSCIDITENSVAYSWGALPAELLRNSKLHSNLAVLMKIIKLSPTLASKEIDLTAVYPDERRLVTQKERRDAKKYDKKEAGMLYRRKPGSNFSKDDINDNIYNKTAKEELLKRLEKFKADKSPSLESTQDLIAHVKESGFPQFMKIKGQTYKLSRMNNMDYDNFVDKARSRPHVEYQLDDETPEFAAYERKRNAMKDLYDMSDEADKQSYFAQVRKFKPPASIKLELTMGKGGITPIRVME